MFLAKKSSRIYVVLYHKFLYKSFSILLTPPPTNPPTPNNSSQPPPSPMQLWMHMGQETQCTMLFKKLRPAAVVSTNFPNSLPTQQLGNLCVTHQSQVTCCGLSYEAVLFSSTTSPGETLHCSKRFAVVWRRGILFVKEASI